MENKLPEFNLTKQDIQALESCGISLSLQKDYRLRRVTDEQGAEMVGQKRMAGRNLAGLAFPIYTEAGGDRPQEYELRRDFPDIVVKNGEEKEEGKYLRPPGRGGLLAIPKDVTQSELDDASIPLIVTEGSKKLWAMESQATANLKPGEKRRFIPVAISGVNNWRGTVGKTTDSAGRIRQMKGLITGFKNINLKHRIVIILFDNDVCTNYKVRIARQQFAATLQAETQAIVYFVDLPKSDKKIGIDDLIGEWQKDFGQPKATQNFLDLLDTKYLISDEVQTLLLGGKLRIGISAGDRGKIKITAKDGAGEVLAMDSLNFSEADKRNKFLKQIEAVFTLTEKEKTEISRELLKLAEVSGLLLETEKPEKSGSGDTVETSFQILKDGRIVEQIRTGFAVYNPDTNEHDILESVTDSDGTTYTPINDELFQKSGGIQIANELTEYETEAALIADVEKYLSRYLDLKPLQLKLAALYILFTYICDLVLELSYLNATGDPGSGKSRFGQTVCIASHRGLALITPSAASLYRIVDKFKPTLFIDEFNSDANSDDSAAVIQILNAGFQKTAQIPRQVATADGKFKTEMFDAFCPKIIGSLKQSASNAFNSRCIEIQMERTTRNDIPLRLSHNLLNDAQQLRNKLTLWRLRNIQNDFEAKLDKAESELRASGIMPRSIQINIPLFALINDNELKRDFINLLKGRDEILNDEKQRTIDGEIVQMMHVVLFDVGEDGSAKWNIDRPQENHLCEALRIEKITSMLNNTNDRKDKPKDHLSERYIGKKIAGFGLISKQILTRKSDFHKKSAIQFDSHRLAVIFRNYGLPIPGDFSLDQLDQNDNFNNDNSLRRSNEESNEITNNHSLDHLNPSNHNNNGKRSNWSKEISEIGSKVLVNEVF